MIVQEKIKRTTVNTMYMIVIAYGNYCLPLILTLMMPSHYNVIKSA